jgi:hypothetical protein
MCLQWDVIKNIMSEQEVSPSRPKDTRARRTSNKPDKMWVFFFAYRYMFFRMCRDESYQSLF